MKIQIPLEITIEHFESVIVTALEGGSNYWYYLPDQLALDFGDWLKGEPLSIKIARKLFDDPKYSLQINDTENVNDCLGKITQASMLKAFQDNPQKTLDIIDENYDAWTADILFQYAVMGEVMFG
jgi:hypothetical protein